MKKISIKQILCAASILAVFLGINSPSFAYCNSPCPNPCSPSRTVCEGTHCTTYCDTTTYYSVPAVSFSYSTPKVSFSISNEVYGGYNYYSRPHLIVSTGFRPVYHKSPPKKPAPNHRPQAKPHKK